MADDYRRHKMDFSFLPSLLSDVGRAKAFVRPSKSEKIMSGLGAIFNVVDALEQDRQMEMVDQKKLDRSIELGKMRSESQEYKELKEEYEPIHNEFKRNFMNIDDENDQDAIIGPRAWNMLKKSRPDYFAAHPTMTYQDFKARKDLVPSQEDNQFYKLADELYTGYRSNLAEKIKMSQKFDEDEFDTNYREAEKLIQGLGSNVLRNSNTLSKLTGSDERRIKLADSYLQSKMANMLNAPIIEAEKAVAAWENSGQALDLEGVRSQVRDAKLGYFNLLPNNAFVHIKGKNQDLVGFQLSLMRSSVTTLQEELGLQPNQLPPKEKLMDSWMLSTIGTFNETDGVKVRRSHLDTQIEMAVKKGGPNVRGEIQALWNGYQRDIEDYADLPTASATERLNHRKQLKALKANPNKDRSDKKLIAHMEIIDNNWGASNPILQNLLDQYNAEDKGGLLEAFPSDVMLTLKGLNDPRISEDTRKELISEVFEGLPFPQDASKIATRVNAHMMTMINDPEFMTKGKELDRDIAQLLIATTREDGGKLNVASLNGYKTHWHTIENMIAANNHHVSKLMKYGGDPKKSMFGGMIDSSDPRLLTIFTNSIIDKTKKEDGKLFIEDPDQNAIMTSLIQYSKSNLRNTQAFGEYMRINTATKERSLSDDFYLGSLQLPTTGTIGTETKNRIVAEANIAVQDLISKNRPAMALELQELIEGKFSGLSKNEETGLYNPFTEESPIEAKVMAIPSDVTTALETAGRAYGLNVSEGPGGNWYGNPMITPKTISRLQRENPHIKPIPVKLAEAIELSRKINLNASILQDDIGKEQRGGWLFDRRKELEEDYQAFNELIADPYIKEVLEEMNLNEALNINIFMDENLKKKVTDTTEETTSIVDDVINSLVPSAEAGETPTTTRSPDELAKIVLAARNKTTPITTRSPDELAKIVLEARDAKEQPKDSLLVPKEPLPKEDLKIPQEFISTLSPEEMKEINRQISKPQKEEWLKDFSITEKDEEFIKDLMEGIPEPVYDNEGYAVYNEKGKAVTKTTKLTRKEAIEFLKEAHISNKRMVQELEKADKPYKESLFKRPEFSNQENSIRFENEILDKTDTVFSTKEDSDAAKVLAILMNSETVYGAGKDLRTKKELKNYLENEINKRKRVDKEKIENQKLIDNSKELSKYAEFIKTLTPDQKNKEFRKLRDKTAALPYETNADNIKNLIGYRKLAMLFPDRKAGKGGTAEATIAGKVNQYEQITLPSTRPSAPYIRALELLKGKFNIEDWKFRNN